MCVGWRVAVVSDHVRISILPVFFIFCLCVGHHVTLKLRLAHENLSKISYESLHLSLQLFYMMLEESNTPVSSGVTTVPE